MKNALTPVDTSLPSSGIFTVLKAATKSSADYHLRLDLSVSVCSAVDMWVISKLVRKRPSKRDHRSHQETRSK